MNSIQKTYILNSTNTDEGDSCKKQRIFWTQNYWFHTRFSCNLTKHFSIYIEFDLNYVELLICEKKNRSLCFRTSICMIHCIDQSKSFTLLLKSNILDFETLSRVHVYRIQYVSYRQGPYRIRIDTADDRIVPALLIITAYSVSNYLHQCKETLKIRKII